MKCKITNKAITPFMSFGKMPIANGFLEKKDFNKEYSFNMEVGFSEDISLFQLNEHPKPEQMFNDKYPSCEGHILFIPKKNTSEYISESYRLLYSWGDKWIKEGKINGYNSGQNVGKCAGQTVMWPHIHFIPRHDGDSDLKKQLNGVRMAHPNGNNRHFY